MILLATTNFFPLSISHSILLVITFNHVQSACILKSEKKHFKTKSVWIEQKLHVLVDRGFNAFISASTRSRPIPKLPMELWHAVSGKAVMTFLPIHMSVLYLMPFTASVR